MPYCRNCGKEHAAEAKFCISCGVRLSGNNETERKTFYDGEIHKCVNCGQILNSFVTVCPSCGYEVRSTRVVNGLNDFISRLENTDTDEQRARLIRNFAIPNTKEDIVDFFILASTNADAANLSEEIADAWLVKLEQCNQKAELMLYKDADYPRIKNIYQKTCKKIKKSRARKRQAIVRTGDNSGNASGIGVLIIKRLLSAIPMLFGMFVALTILGGAVSTNVAGGNSATFEMIGGILLIALACALGRNNVGYIEIFSCGFCGVLCFSFAGRMKNGAGLEMIGVIVLLIVAFNFFKALRRESVQQTGG